MAKKILLQTTIPTTENDWSIASASWERCFASNAIRPASLFTT